MSINNLFNGSHSMGQLSSGSRQSDVAGIGQKIIEDQIKADREWRESRVIVPKEEYEALIEIINACIRKMGTHSCPEYLREAVMDWNELRIANRGK